MKAALLYETPPPTPPHRACALCSPRHFPALRPPHPAPPSSGRSPQTSGRASSRGQKEGTAPLENAGRLTPLPPPRSSAPRRVPALRAGAGPGRAGPACPHSPHPRSNPLRPALSCPLSHPCSLSCASFSGLSSAGPPARRSGSPHLRPLPGLRVPHPLLSARSASPAEIDKKPLPPPT